MNLIEIGFMLLVGTLGGAILLCWVASASLLYSTIKEELDGINTGVGRFLAPLAFLIFTGFGLIIIGLLTGARVY